MAVTAETPFKITSRISAGVSSLWERQRDFTSVAIFWFLLLSMVITRAIVGMYGMTIHSHDGFMVLDGAWRMLNGQRPHTDFNSMIGPAAYLPTVVGLLLSSNSVAGFGYGQALVALVLGIWAYVLGARLYDTPRVAYALCVAAIAVSPGWLGSSPFALTPAVTYNRYGYALLGILLLECLSREHEFEVITGFSSGAVVGITAFLKMTSFFGAVALILLLLPQRTQTSRRWIGLIGGAFLVSFGFLWYLHFNVPAIFRDLALTAAAKRVRLYDLYLLNSIVLDAGVVLILTFGAYLFLMDHLEQQGARRILLAGLGVVFVSVLLIFGNAQPSELPLLGLFLLVVGHRLFAEIPAGAEKDDALRTMVIGASALIAGINILSASISLTSAAHLMTHSAQAAPRFQTPVLRQFVPDREQVWYTNYVNDGISLLEKHRKQGERVMSLDFTNPFSYGLLIPPAPGGSTNLNYNGSFDARHKVSPEELFGAADLVMLPKVYSDESLQFTVPAIYGPFLESHFQLVGESSDWKLYRKTS